MTSLVPISAPVAGSVIPFYFADQTTFPDATDNHGAIVHSHADGAMYFAHDGTWHELALAVDLRANTATQPTLSFRPLVLLMVMST